MIDNPPQFPALLGEIITQLQYLADIEGDAILPFLGVFPHHKALFLTPIPPVAIKKGAVPAAIAEK